jgi:hypothetical protein
MMTFTYGQLCIYGVLLWSGVNALIAALVIGIARLDTRRRAG